jgi:hypothetical protein
LSFDISRLTNAVNKYLNSISDVGAAASKASQEIADRTRFATDLGDAIKRNIASRTKEMDSVPDIASIVQDQVQQATGGINSTFEQVNGAFLEISEAGKSAVAKESAAAVSGANSGKASSGTTAKSANRDAYSGTLSTEALKELSNSQYFSANLIQSSLFQKSDGESDNSSSSQNNALSSLSSALTSSLGSATTTADAFDTKTLEQFNTDSLVANSLGTGSTLTGSEVTGNDLAKALIKAYTSSSKASEITSVFGDFSL